MATASDGSASSVAEVTVAALYVEADGPYAGLDSVDIWPIKRDARLYDGPHPVVAHPPCNRWCQIASINVSQGHFKLGDDGGCFASALDAVRKFGGILEHPARTYAWKAYGLPTPLSCGGWIRTLFDNGWVCEVEQGNYGCPAPKPTWLYAVNVKLLSLKWGKSSAKGMLSHLRYRGKYIAVNSRLDGKIKIRGKLASRTPHAFQEVLLDMARSVCGNSKTKTTSESS